MKLVKDKEIVDGKLDYNLTLTGTLIHEDYVRLEGNLP